MLKAFTDDPTALLQAINAAIEDGTVTTWLRTTSGSYTHTTKSDQWKNLAWFKPSVVDNAIIFNILRPKGSNVSKTVYAVYHGRFSEMLLTHFDTKLTSIRLTALAGDGDVV
jgi:hypothetical protein